MATSATLLFNPGYLVVTPMNISIAGNKPKFLQSITIQILTPMAVIGLLALSSMLVSVLVTLNTQHDAEAINIAGSMRMQSYRIAVLLQRPFSGSLDHRQLSESLSREQREFSRKLYQSSIFQIAGESDEHTMKTAYQKVKDNWENTVVPLLSPIVSKPTASEGQIADASAGYLAQVDSQVADIDNLVFSIQQNTEEKIELLGMYEGLSIFLSFLALVFIVMRTDQNLVRPLRDLVRAAEHTSLGDFSYRTYYQGVNEMGLLCSTFNAMSASLARHYRELEDLVDEKTSQLQQTNQMLDFLYNTAQRLSEGAIDHRKLELIITELKKVTGIPQLSLCLANQANTDKYDLIMPIGQQHPCLIGDCVNCFMRPEKKHLENGEISFPIEDSNDNFGFLYAKTGLHLDIEPWQLRLIEAVAENLSTAMALQYREGISQRLMLFEERSIIARELHDSLAQSLSYMKFQVARIDKLFDRKASEEQIREGVEDLQQGLNAAYKHLRELLTTFRLKLDTPSLLHALRATTDEFDRVNDNIDIVLNYDLGNCPLSPNEDIHTLHIIREAITNAVKHAKAGRIELNCKRGSNNSAVFSVVDDGIGIPSSPDRDHHYGLSTMRERATLVAGTLEINSSQDQQGTEVVLTFTPEAFR